MRIRCPECESSLALKAPKPGSYQPKCNKCGKPFRLKVSNDDPPRVGVGKLKSGSNAKRPAKNSKVASKQPSDKQRANTAVKQPATKSLSPGTNQPAVIPSGEGRIPSGEGRHAIDATIEDPSLVNANAPDRTMESDAMAQTMDGTIVEGAVSDTAIGVAMDATMDSSGSKAGHPKSVSVHSASTNSASEDNVTTSGSRFGPHQFASVAQSEAQSMVRSGKSQPSASRGGSHAQASSEASPEAAAGNGEVPERLGGYRILRLLGRGAMGAVYEAKQVSLDRFVALKTIRSRLASNPATLARFTREAYAAAQLTHHNVVQIYDFGEESGKHFFSMEWVRGGPLDELVKEKGALDSKLAAGYILQAARGLSVAHRHGMVHRDIKPANLLLNDEGVVKVADLGLVKIPDLPDPSSDVGASSSDFTESGTHVTMQGTAVGTPAYMAPEQSVDAASVDHRADIYSLGCTLFFLLSGKPPYGGSVVSEVMEQHANHPIPNIQSINSRVPQQLDQIIWRSMAKRPADRYESLEQMCDDLESYLGINNEGKFTPTSQQADEFESISATYAKATKAEASKGLLFWGLAGGSALLALLTLMMGWTWWLMGPTFFLTAIGLSIGLAGGQSQVHLHFRQWLGSLRWLDYAVGIMGAVAIVVVGLISGLWLGIFVGSIFGAVAGTVHHLLVTSKTAKAGDVSVDKARRFIRDLRISGADEQGIRSFVARYGGRSWQRIFEKLFGYESLLAQCAQLKGDPTFNGDTSINSLRDRTCANLHRRIEANRQRRDHVRLADLEQKGLQAEGLGSNEAKERAWQMAAAVMDASQVSGPAASDAATAAQEKRDRIKAMLADARSGKYAKKRDKLALIRWILGGQTRFLAGCLLLAVFAIWGNQNGIFDSFKEIDYQQIKPDEINLDGVQTIALKVDIDNADVTMAGCSFNLWSVGIAGLLLLFSSFVSGWRMTPFAIIATIAIILGPSLGIPGFGDVFKPWMVAAAVGVCIYAPGVVLGETRED